MIKRLIDKLFLKLGYIPIMGTLIVKKQDYRIEEIKINCAFSEAEINRNSDGFIYRASEELKMNIVKSLIPFVEIEVQDDIPYQMKRIYGRIFVAQKKL